jgi:imidazolonepropionase-like amidohydrolase
VASPDRYAIYAAELFDGLGGEQVVDAALIVAQGRITAVGTRDELAAELRDVPVLDFDGGTILPGLIDPHVHLALRPELAAEESIAFAETAARGEVLAAMEANASRAHAAGVTTVRDCGSPGTAGVAFREIARTAPDRLPRVLVSGRPITTTGGHCHWMGLVADSEDQVVSAVEELCAEDVDFIKVMATGGMMTAGTDPFRGQYPAATLTRLVDAAHGHGRRVAAHALSSPGVAAALASGVDTIEHCVTTTPARQDYDPAVASKLASAGIVVGVTAHSPLRTLLAAGDHDGIHARLEPHRQLRAAGVDLVVHSDAGTPGTAFEDFPQSVEIFRIGLETTVGEAIAAATSRPAAALGLERETGSLRPGLAADVVVTGGRLSSDLHSLRRPACVIRGGALPPREELW